MEDDPAISELVLLALAARDDLELVHVATGPDAIARFPEVKPDLMLFDVMVPDLDGIDAARTIKEQHKDHLAPVIFMTAKTQAKMQIESMGALGIIAKPFDILVLADQIEEMYAAGIAEQSGARVEA
nr:response regulator [Parvularcula mediterranea]